MTEPSPAFHERLCALVEAALGVDAGDRDELLRRRAGDDQELLLESRKMVAMAIAADGAFGEDELLQRRQQLEAALDSATEMAAGNPGLEGWMPESIGPYSIDHLLGRGGTGIVLAAHQSTPDRAVALKVLHPALAIAESTHRLLKEADALGRLQHPGIAQIFEGGTFDFGAGDQPFIAMELVDGPGLMSFADGAGLTLRQRMELLARVCDAVDHAHSRGVVHRDLKPENVLVTRDGQPKLVDFGIASVARDSAVSAHGLTLDGQVLGTVAYMAPEQARAVKNADWRLSDVFSIGAMGFELVTGSRPRQLEGLVLTQVLLEITEQDIPNPRKLRGTIDRDIDTIIAKATASEPIARYQSVGALAADIRRFLQDRTITARAPGPVEKAAKFTRRHRALVAGSLTTAAALIAGTVVATIQARVAWRAEAEVVKKLYAAEMLVASESVMEPVTRSRTWEYVERWRDRDVIPGWEWHLLASVRRRNVVALDLPASPFGIAWRPDGRAVAVSMGSLLGVFDPDTGEALSIVRLDNESCLLKGIVWSTDGDRLVAGGVGEVVMWRPGVSAAFTEVAPGEFLWRQPVTFVNSPLWDGRSDEIICLDSTLKHFDAATGELRSERPFGGTRTNGPRLDPTGELVVTWGHDRVLARRLDDWSPVTVASTSIPEPRGEAWHPRGDRIAHAGTDGTVRVIDPETGDEMLRIDDFHESVFSVDWHPTKNLLLASSEDGTVRVFDAGTGAVQHVLLRHQSVAEEARWSPDGTRVASVAIDGEALIWSLDEKAALRTWYEPRLAAPDRFIAMEAVPGRCAFRVVAYELGGEFDLDSDEAPLLTVSEGAARASTSGIWSSTTGWGETIAIRRHSDSAAQSPSSYVEVGQQPRIGSAWSPDPEQDVLLAGSMSGLWRIEPQLTGPPESRQLREIPGGVAEITWSPCTAWACVTTHDGNVFIIDPASGEIAAEYSLAGNLSGNAACWSPDSKEIAVGCADGAIRTTAVPDGTDWRVWRGHANQVEGVAWSPDGTRIAGASRDRSVKVWDTATGDIVASFDCTASVADVLWLADGAVLAAVDVEGRSYAWDARRSLNGSD